MPQVGFILADDRKVSFDDCISGEVETLVPRPLLVSIIQKLRTDPHQGAMLSVTGLIGCLRSVYFERTRDYYAELIQNWYPHRGTVMHKALEAEMDGWLMEETFSREFGGLTVSGRIDAYDLENQVLYDWKTTSGPRLQWMRSNGIPNDHVLQLNAYRLLMGEKYPVKEMRLMYLAMNELGITGLGEPPWPKSVCGLQAVEFLDDQMIIDRFSENAAILNRAFEDGELPPVAGEETRRWKCRRFCPVNSYCEEVGDNPTLSGPVWATDHAWAAVPTALSGTPVPWTPGVATMLEREENS